jgi:predicted nucleic acid-binding protein
LILGEACFLLQAGYLRRRLQFLLDNLSPSPIELAPPWWSDVFAWLERYEEHAPDLADAQLAVLCSRDLSHSIWSYDSEFHTIWRRQDGSRLPVIPSTPRKPARRQR